MLTRYLLLALLATSPAAFAEEIECPAGTSVNSEDSPGGLSAWCELDTDRSLLHGPYRAWYASGVLGTQENFRNGKATGKATYHWGSGHKQAEGNYRDGVREGWWDFWDKTGMKVARVRYQNGAVVAGQLPKWAVDWPPTPVGQRAPAQP